MELPDRQTALLIPFGGSAKEINKHTALKERPL